MVNHLASLTTQCLVLMILQNWENNLVLVYQNKLLKESRRDLYLYLRITLLMVIYYEMQRVLLDYFLMESG